MYKSLILKLLCAGAIFGITVFPASSYAGSATFSEKISIAKSSLHKNAYKHSGYVWIEAAITNISNKTRSIVIWTQSGWSWVSSNPVICPGITAAQNFATTISLKPGEEYDYRVDVYICSVRRSKRPITFRLGFIPDAKQPASNIQGVVKSGDVTWSNYVTLTQ